MKSNPVVDYQKKLEAFRFHYFTTYGVKLDDEVLYFFIRVNEMQTDLKKQITEIPKLQFETGWHYFLYGLGRFTIVSMIISIMVTLIFVFAPSIFREDNITIIKGVPVFKIKQSDSTYYLPLKSISK